MSYFENCMYFSANQLARHLTSIADDIFKEIDITVTQGFTLIAISKLDKHTPSEIAVELEMKPSTITRFLDKLEKLGYVKRTYLGRKTDVGITQTGLDKIESISEAWEKIHEMYYKTLGDNISENLTKEIVKANKLFKENKDI
ncbi:MarR family winged helix-turn-helix transcriptional regulator [Clostridium sp. DL1XJH146]